MKAYWRAVFRRQWPILTVAAIGLVALVLVAAGFWRRGALLIGIGVGRGRRRCDWLLPEDRAGLLVVRTRTIDCGDDGHGVRGGGLHRLDHRPAGDQLRSRLSTASPARTP